MAGPNTSARVDIQTNDKVTWQDAFQFNNLENCGCTGVTGPQWQLIGTFNWDIVANNWNAASVEPSLSLYSAGDAAGTIVVDDINAHILHANVPPLVLTGGVTGATGATGPGLLPGRYRHALRFTMASSGAIIELLHGDYIFSHGV